MLNRPIRVFSVAVALAVILAVTLVLCRSYGERTNELQAQLKALSREQVALEAEKSALQIELTQTESSSYIMQVAREDYGYLLPGEIRFHVTNIDDLYAVHEVTVEDTP